MKAILKRNDLIYPELSYQIIGCAYEVYNELGSGHHEKYYQRALAKVLDEKKIIYQEQVYSPLKFRDSIIGRSYLDFLIDNKVIVELKKDSRFSKKHIDQVLNYLKLTEKQLAILINFASEGVMFKRIINVPSLNS